MSDIDLTPDVLVVGGGVAGMLAAARAREQGASVVLVKKSGGGTHASSGAVDVADDLVGLVPGPTLDPFDRGGRWRRAADGVAAKKPRHPYAREARVAASPANGASSSSPGSASASMGSGSSASRDRIREALSLLKQLCKAGGLELVERDDGCNHVVATQLGTVKRTALVQRSQLLDIGALDGDVLVGVVEPLDLAGFSARSVVHMLSWIAGQSQRKIQLTPVVVERSLPGRELFSSCYEMAHRLDDAAVRNAFLEALRVSLRKQTRTPLHLLFPPILGVDNAPVVHADVERAAGRTVRELLALPSSAPGDRLQRALTAGVKKLGVAVVEGAARQGRFTEQRVTTVVVEGGGLRAEIKPKTLVLAGGRFFSGGLVRDGDAREPLLGLAVVADGAVIGDSFIGDHLGQSPEADHAIFRAGLAVDDALRPLDAGGRVAFDNVACAGTIVDGWDPARDGTGAGVAALMGFVAGERAARSR